MAQKPGLGASERCLRRVTLHGRLADPRIPRYTDGMETSNSAMDVESPCQACGACCSYSSNWPRFTTEDDAALDLIPEKFVNEKLSGMRCDGDRCSALSGRVGVATSCGIYAVRPEVCRTCMPGDPECGMARRRHGLPALA
jgi:Fe-S-cluster containining protein